MEEDRARCKLCIEKRIFHENNCPSESCTSEGFFSPCPKEYPMFTGIIEEVGVLTKVRGTASARSLTIAAEEVVDSLQIGDSIATLRPVPYHSGR